MTAPDPQLTTDDCRTRFWTTGSWDFEPDRSNLELRSPEPEPPKADRRGDWGCSVFALALSLLLLVAGCTVAAPPLDAIGAATSPVGGANDGAVGLPAVASMRPAATVGSAPVGASSVKVRRLATDAVSMPAPSPLPITGTAADVSFSGSLWWAKPSYGPRYLAIRWPRGTIATLCGPADCVTRASTDFGPVLSLWEKGRLADMSAADFEKVCGMSAAQRILHGHCPGTLLIVKRGRIVLPQTSTKEGP